MNYSYTFLLGSSIIFIDRLTKWFALTYCLDEAYSINEHMTFDVTINYGVSWGLLNHGHGITAYIVTLFTIIITTLLVYVLYKNMKKQKQQAYFYALSKNKLIGSIAIIAGSISNIIDRLLYGGVIDFIALSYKQWSWPVFNLADIAIVCGVGLILYDCYVHE